MAMSEIKLKWTEIGKTVISESGVSEREKLLFFAPLIKYDDGRKNKKVYCYDIQQQDAVDFFANPTFFAMETKTALFIFNDEGEIMAKCEKEKIGDALWIQYDGIVSYKNETIIKTDPTGKVIKTALAKEFLTPEIIEQIKNTDQKKYEKLLEQGIIAAVNE